MMRISLLAPFCLLLGCGPLSSSSAELKNLPDNYPVRTTCYGLSQDLKEAIRVRSDDAADIRLCASVQKDGHVGLDINYHPQVVADPIFALVSLRGDDGRNATGLFPLVVNPITGAHELYLTDGCSVGSVGGCSQQASKKMQELFEALHYQDQEKIATFNVDLAFVSVKNENELRWDLHDSLRKSSYTFKIEDL